MIVSTAPASDGTTQWVVETGTGGVERRRGRRQPARVGGGNHLPMLEPGMKWYAGRCISCEVVFRTRKLSDAHSVACAGPMMHGVDFDLRGLEDN